MSIAFVTFLGAFFTIVINVLGGARSIDISYLRAAQSMGASQLDLFWKIVLPGTLPSIFTGAAAVSLRVHRSTRPRDPTPNLPTDHIQLTLITI